MATFWGLDIKSVTFYEIYPSGANEGGIKATSTSPYSGVNVPGARSFTIAEREPRRFSNVSAGRVNDTITLPSIEPITATLTCSYESQEFRALLTRASVFNVADLDVLSLLTDRQGEELTGTLMITALVLHDQTGKRVYGGLLIPRATLVPSMYSFNQDPVEITYNISIGQNDKMPWGTKLSIGTHGVTLAGAYQFIADNPVYMVGWLADGTATSFSLPTDHKIVSSSKAAVYNYSTGTTITGTWTNDDTFTVSTAPADGTLLVCVYERQM